ncbi:hypothetical protein [Ectobacillus funiculus]|uniref:Uncharacterized protein n=1 Tax=Ectobacillus funiculus TaxID=137993 RepID=A0ABV5WJC3_9BACI
MQDKQKYCPLIGGNELFPTNQIYEAPPQVSERGVAESAPPVITFLFLMTFNQYGLETTLYLCAGLLFLGCIISLIMAPETKNMNLTKASYVKAPFFPLFGLFEEGGFLLHEP